MDETLTGHKRRYHVESLIKTNPFGRVYRAFSRRRSGKKLMRRYYAILEVVNDGSSHAANDALESAKGVWSDSDEGSLFRSELSRSLGNMPYPVRIEEEFTLDGVQYVVIAKGKPLSRGVSRWQSVQNKGYLMLLLAALILVLLLYRFYIAPPSPDKSIDEVLTEEVDK